MKTNTLLGLCAVMLGAILMLLVMIGNGNFVTAQDGGDSDKNTGAQSGSSEFAALAVATDSGREVVVVIKEVDNLHPNLNQRYPKALSMAAYTVDMSGSKSGELVLLSTRQISADLAFPELGKLNGKMDLERVEDQLTKYAEGAQKIADKRKEDEDKKKKRGR